jgi:hypothetical protein
VGLTQLGRFLVVELTNSGLNYRFDMNVVFTTNNLLVVDNVPVDREMLLVTDFMNLKIKSTQSFSSVYRGRMCVCIHKASVHMYMSIYIYTMCACVCL